MYTEEDIRAWVAANKEDLDEAYREADYLPEGAKHVPLPEGAKHVPHIRNVFDIGCWLNLHLKERGATKEQAESIGFVHGQRCFGGCPYFWAVRIMNEFVENGDISDKPGPELAESICREACEREKKKKEKE